MRQKRTQNDDTLSVDDIKAIKSGRKDFRRDCTIKLEKMKKRL